MNFRRDKSIESTTGLKIVFVAPDAYAATSKSGNSHIGGAETQQFQFAQALRDIGHEVLFIVAKLKCSNTINHDSVPSWIRVAYSLRDKSSKIGFLKDSLKLYKSMRKTGADIFIQRCSFHDAPRVYIFSRLLGAKFIFWIGADFNVNCEWMTNNLSWFRRIVYEIALRGADEVISQTNKQFKLLDENYNLHSTIVRNIVIASHKPSSRKDDEYSQTAIWGGRINKNKQPQVLLEIARKSPNWTFFVAAIKGRILSQEYDNFVRKARRISNIVLYESLPHNEYLRLTSLADLILNTSLYEGYPNTLLEAFVRGIPALTLGVNPDSVITKHNMGWVCTNVDEAVARMEQLASQPELLRTAGESALVYAKNFHSKEIVINQLNELLRNMMHDDRS